MALHSMWGAVHRHRTGGVGSIPVGEPIVDDLFSTVPGQNFDIPLDTKIY